MTVELQHDTEHKFLEVRLEGKLTADDYRQFVPEVERLIGEYGKVRLLLELHDFHGWTAGALWEDLKFDLKHFRDIERLAIVGEKRWQSGMAQFCRPFTTAEIRYFDRNELDDARTWVSQHPEAEQPVTAGEVYQQPQ